MKRRRSNETRLQFNIALRCCRLLLKTFDSKLSLDQHDEPTNNATYGVPPSVGLQRPNERAMRSR